MYRQLHGFACARLPTAVPDLPVTKEQGLHTRAICNQRGQLLEGSYAMLYIPAL